MREREGREKRERKRRRGMGRVEQNAVKKNKEDGGRTTRSREEVRGEEEGTMLLTMHYIQAC